MRYLVFAYGRRSVFKLNKLGLWRLKKNLYILYLVLRHQKTPFKFKAAIVAMAAYLLWPIDFIPDFIPGFGLIDNFVVLMLTMTVTLKLLPEDILRDCREKTEMKPLALKLKKALIFLALIILAWGLIFFFVITQLKQGN